MTDSAYPALVISLDFELYWGVVGAPAVGPEHRRQIASAREAVARILDVFDRREIHATWATVGFLFARSQAEIQAHHPGCMPAYHRTECNNYRLPVGIDEAEDPMHFAPSLVERIRATRHQELASHSFSHYYCEEPGQGPKAFSADLEAAQRIAEQTGGRMRSYVFPRNQVNRDYLPLLAGADFDVYRADPPAREEAKRRAMEREPLLRERIGRFLDRYWNLSGDHGYPWSTIAQSRPCKVQASWFLPPYSYRFRVFEPLRVRRVVKSMEATASRNDVFHLWWHPHNFGQELEANLTGLNRVLDGYETLRDRYGMRSLTMAEAADEAQRLCQRP